jgi:glucosamine-6-phosphate deaminase
METDHFGMIPNYLNISATDLGQGTPVKIRVLGDMVSIARDVAETMKAELLAALRAGRAATLIVPVGPVDPFPILAKVINDEQIDCRDVVLINMDEYLTDDDQFVPRDHPLSFRGYMDRAFYQLLEPALAPRPENRVFPDPNDCGAIQRLIDRRGGVDACFGGIGINGHVAFNEPPENAEGETPNVERDGGPLSVEHFAALPTRVLSLARETRTINSVTVGGGIEVVPRRCVTVGMKEILGARRLRFYCNRPWQSAVVRRVLHGPITPACPASLLRLHPDATITVADYVAAPPNIGLR